MEDVTAADRRRCRSRARTLLQRILYTHVDTEGLMGGTGLEAILKGQPRNTG